MHVLIDERGVGGSGGLVRLLDDARIVVWIIG